MAATREWLSGIYEISKIINATLELGEILDVVARETRRLIDFDRLVLGLLDDTGERLRLLVPVASPGTTRPTGSLIPLDGHVLGEVTRTRQTLSVADLRADPRFPADHPLAEEGVVSCIALPLVSANRILGALAFARREPHPFSGAEAELLHAVAEQVATALDHAKLFAAERKRANHLAIINQVARHALATFDLPTLLSRTATLIQQQFNYYDVSLFMVDRAAREVVLSAQAGAYHAASAIGYRQPLGIGIVGHAADACITVVANDVAQDPHYVVAFEGERASKAELAVPVKLAGQAVGVINVECTEVGAFDQIDVMALETLADLVAQAIENARLVDETVREKQELDDIVSAMGAGVALIDRDLTILWSNKTLNTWFAGGRSAVGQKCHVVHANPAAPCPNCMAKATFNTGEIRTDIQVHHDPSRGPRHYEHIFAPVRDHEGKVREIIMLAFDVTEHARNVEQLALLRRLSELMQGVVELDRLLHLILTCVTAGPGLGFNRAILLLVNDDRTMLEGRLGVGPASHEEAARIWRELAQRAQTLDDVLALFDSPGASTDTAMRYLARQIRIPLSDTSQVPIRALTAQRPILVTDAYADPGVTPHLRSLLGARQFVCVPLIARDTALGAILADNVFSNHPLGGHEVQLLQTYANQAGLAISAAAAYKRLEEQLNELEETRDRLVRSERLAVVGRLAAHVAHEIRNPLATIGGFTRAMLRSPDDTPKVERNARIILEEVERLEQILANVMNFTKPGSPVCRERDINESVEAICAFHEHVFAERKITVHKSLDPNCPILRFDPDQMRQVLLNLCQNAIESMPHGGELTVLTRALDDRVEVVIADTGQGMTESVLESMFQPFFTTKPGGTGLGLSVCQKIIHDHGGDILIRSRPGAGSSVTVTLPIPENSADS